MPPRQEHVNSQCRGKELQSTHRLFDYFIGTAKQICWNGEGERLRGLHTDSQLDSGRLRVREISRPLAFEKAARIAAGEAPCRQSRGSWVLGWLDEMEKTSPYEEGLRETMDKLRTLYPKPRPIKFAEITKDSILRNAYLWYKQLSSDAAHPSLEALSRHITRQEDGSLLVSIEPVAREKDILDTMEWACQALMGVTVCTNQIAGPTKAGEKLAELCDEFIRLTGIT